VSAPRLTTPRQTNRALVAGWYRWFLAEHRSLDDVVNRWPARLRPVVWRSGPVQALTLLVAGRHHPVIAVLRRDRGWRSLLLLSAMVHRHPKLVVFHFIDHPDRRRGIRGGMDRVWWPVERWALRRALLRAQVLSPWESAIYGQRYGIAQERFRFVPFAWRHPAQGAPASFSPAAERAGVLSAGRVSCDWPTLFAAARDEAWPMTVVCSAVDRDQVDALNRPRRATVHSDLSEAQVQELLERSAVAVIAAREGGRSQGHVRLCASVDAGAPVVATRTRSLEGYVEEGRTAVVISPGDPSELRAAINGLLGDPAARDEIAQAAWDRAGNWTWDDYLAALSELARPDGQAAASSSGASSRREMTLDTPSSPMETP
jgi:glycosyltransferase involved in cell wall biosynthesis